MNYPGYPMYYPVGGPFPTHQLSDDAGKIFVGGIPADATKEILAEYFSQFGEVSECIIMVDNITGRSRGFGFVTFHDQMSVGKVTAQGKHSINGKVVDAKRAVPKGPNQSSILRAMGITSNRADRNPERKLFVGGVAQGTTESDLETYFKDYGKVLEVKIPKDQSTQRARGFSFVLFESIDSVINATKERYHRINGKTVEVKTVNLQQNRSNKMDRDDVHLQSPQSPFLISHRPSGYYPYPQNYLASLGSTGFGSIHGSGSAQRLDEYPFMTQLYHGMNDLSLNASYQARSRNYTPIPRAQYAVPGGDQIPTGYTTPTGHSASSMPFHNELSGYSSPPLFYAGPVPASYVPASTPQPVPAVPTFNR